MDEVCIIEINHVMMGYVKVILPCVCFVCMNGGCR